MKVMIAMSGGVDSGTAAQLLRNRGYECVGCTMRLLDGPEAEQAVEDARAAAAVLGIPFVAPDYRELFRESVILPFVRAYEEGKTPNPCVRCNQQLKFGALLRLAEELGCEKLATGHYARIEASSDGLSLKKALDEGKDQSYFLYTLTQSQLARVLFPLGEMNKETVRETAASGSLPMARKKDSQDICFVPDGDYASVIEQFGQKKITPGDFIDMDGKVLGTHRGIIHYTPGQRRGLGVAFGKPLYVRAIDPLANTVQLGENSDLFSRTLGVEDFSWVAGFPPSPDTFRCKARIRSRHAEQWAEVTPLGMDRVRVCFEEPQRAVTPGQSAVLYDGDTVLGGGIITAGLF